MRRIPTMALLAFLSGRVVTSPAERTDDWWLGPRVEISVEYRPLVYLPAEEIRDAQCTPRDHFLAPWVTEFQAEISAYSSEGAQTDSDPWIASDGRRVFEGGIATNTLPCGTRVMIPDLFGDRIFVVNDRMHPRYQPMFQEHGLVNLDVWMTDKKDAKEVGRQTDVRVIVLQYAGA